MPGSSSIKAPYGRRLTIFPCNVCLEDISLQFVPMDLALFALGPVQHALYRIDAEDQDLQFLSKMHHFGRMPIRFQVMSVIWRSPSIPSRSRKTPKSVIFLTTPSRFRQRAWFRAVRLFLLCALLPAAHGAIRRRFCVRC